MTQSREGPRDTVLVLIQVRDQVESGSRLPGHSPVAMP